MYPVGKPFTLKRHLNFSSCLKALVYIHLQMYWRCLAGAEFIQHCFIKNEIRRWADSARKSSTVREAKALFLHDRKHDRTNWPMCIHREDPYFTVHAPWTGRSLRSFVSWFWSITSQWTLCVSVDPAAETEARKEMLCQVFLLLFVLFCCFFLFVFHSA